MTKAPKPKRTKDHLLSGGPTAQAASQVLRRGAAELRRNGGGKFDISSPEAQKATLAEWRTGMFEALSLPLVAAEIKRAADKHGTTVEVMMHGMLAKSFHDAGQPLPPDLREYLATQDMPPALRVRFLKPGLS